METAAARARPWWKHWWGILLLVFLLVLGLYLAYFVQQFFKFYLQARRGDLTSPSVFAAQFTRSEALAAGRPVAAESGQTYATADDPSLGSPSAKLIVVEFADFGCPFSREASFTLRELAARFPDRFSYIYRDFPIDELHPEARLAAEAGECAKELGNFWAFHDKLYQNQRQLKREDLLRYGQEIGLDEPAFQVCLDSGRYAAEVEADYAEGKAAGVIGTPTFFLNGVRVEGAIPKDRLETLINQF
ncbi:DsbA family protein [Candidatus Uhrbacteria bacterium]|nr:DsbA family protein [Candidatus Uhrbacteria bacterium]